MTSSLADGDLPYRLRGRGFQKIGDGMIALRPCCLVKRLALGRTDYAICTMIQQPSHHLRLVQSYGEDKRCIPPFGVERIQRVLLKRQVERIGACVKYRLDSLRHT